MRILDAAATREALPMADAIDAMRLAFGPDTEAPLRQRVGPSLFMPGRVGDRVAVKAVSVVPGNPVGIVIVFDESGSPIGIVDGPTITAIRTGAVAGLATDLLAPAGATSLAMIGAGAMAADQIDAIATVRDLDRIIIWSRDRSHAEALADRYGADVADTPDEAVAGAGIVTTATPARTPLFSSDSLARTVHINAVGAFTPEMAEIPPEFVRDAFVVVDDHAAAKAEAGDLIQAGRTADIDLPTLLSTKLTREYDRTLFKSVGVATQDVAAAARALHNAGSEQ